MESKTCESCNKTKSLDQFNRSNSGHGHGANYYPHCKECCALKRHAAGMVAKNFGMTKQEWIKQSTFTQRENQTEVIFKKLLANPPQLKRYVSNADQYDPTTTKQCRICNLQKQLSEFNKGRAAFGRHDYCRCCHRLKHRAWTEVAKKHNTTRRQLTKTLPKEQRTKEINDMVFLLLATTQPVSATIAIKFTKPKPEKLPSRRKRLKSLQETTPPYHHEKLEGVRDRHKTEVAKLNNKTTGMTEGFVYVMSNPKEINRYKVGFAIDYESRKNTLNTADSNRGFKVEFAHYAEHAKKLERRVHIALDKWAVPNSDEWFETDIENIKEVILKTAEKYGPITCSSSSTPPMPPRTCPAPHKPSPASAGCTPANSPC